MITNRLVACRVHDYWCSSQMHQSR